MGKRKADNFIASDDDEEDRDFDKSESERSLSSEEEKKPKSRKVHLSRTVYSLVRFVLTPYRKVRQRPKTTTAMTKPNLLPRRSHPKTNQKQ
jgi:hypothetical protein